MLKLKQRIKVVGLVGGDGVPSRPAPTPFLERAQLYTDPNGAV